MSARNGDKARFHRQRKQKIARRKRTLELVERARRLLRAAQTLNRPKPKAVSA